MRTANVAFFPRKPPAPCQAVGENRPFGLFLFRPTPTPCPHPTIALPAPYPHLTCALPSPYHRPTWVAAPSDFMPKSEGAATQVGRWYGEDTKMIPHLPCAVQDLAGNAHLRASGRFGGSGKMFYLCSTDWSVCFSVFGINRRRKALRSSLYSGRIASAEQGDCIGGMQKCCRLSSDVTHRVVSVGFAA